MFFEYVVPPLEGSWWQEDVDGGENEYSIMLVIEKESGYHYAIS